MNKIKEFLENYLIHIICVLFMLVVWNNCSQSSTNRKLVKQNSELVLQLDSIKRYIPTEEKLLLEYDKQMYEFLKLSLYDWNTVVRTTQRPDDIIKTYDNKVKEIETKLKNLK
jgi:hypothetical protein